MSTIWSRGSQVRRPLANSLSQAARFSFPFLLFLTAFIPRAVHHVETSDIWHIRGKSFMEALLSQDWNATLQAPHPGVITMWLVALTQSLGGFFVSGFDGFSLDQQMSLELIPIALVIALTLVLAYFLLVDIFDRLVAAVAVLLLALDPHHISLSQAIHVDALVSVFMMISALYLWLFMKRSRRRYLLLSGLFAALGLLTKTPAIFMVPYFFLALAVWQVDKRLFVGQKLALPERRDLVEVAKEIGLAIVIWFIAFGTIYFLLWPSMWSQPGNTLEATFGGSDYYFDNPHEGPLFFLGQPTNEDPGPLFYPINMAIEATAVVSIGFLLSLILIFNRTLERQKWIALLMGLAFIFFFTLMMTLGEKKFARYALPALQFVILLAGLGFVYFFRRLTRGKTPWLYLSLALIVLFQAAVSIPRHPYYGTHYNYLLGGPKFILNNGIVAGQEKSEGLEIAAEYLNSMPMSPLLVVGTNKFTAFYRYFQGKAVPMTDDKVDYLVFARNSVIRDVEDKDMQQLWEAYKTRKPKLVVEFDGVPYVWVYKTGPVISDEDIPYPVTANIGEYFRLLGYDFEPKEVSPGDSVQLTYYWESVNQTDADYTVFSHLLDQDGQLRSQKDGQPQGGKYPTYLWENGERVMDAYVLAIDPDAPPGRYDLAVGMYDLQTMERLPITSQTGEFQPEDRLVLPGPMITSPAP